ncbi:MAG TPA: DUF4160 domain-containing protein [Planctomycetota bacterium]|nr:DUF4160 domain-containing protein [Planctomycetota bacterium]
MPEISRFFGIVIRMYYMDHRPPHFPAVYGDHEALVRIDTFELFGGHLPRRALALVLEWGALHREELNSDWKLAREGRPVRAIEPLE